MRLFIALNLPESERERIYQAAEPLRAREYPVRWIAPLKFHVTLKFLGTVRSEMIPVVEKVVRKVASETDVFDLSLGGFGAFPTIRRPRVLWLGVNPTPALRCLKQDLEWGLASHGFERETRAFHPHVTLGRASQGEGAGAFRGLDELAAKLDYFASIPLKAVDVMRSQLSREGAQYTLMESSPLKGHEDPAE